MIDNIPLTPRETVSELDKHIIGQDDAKRAVAIAFRDRWRRMQLEEGLRDEVTPKNILMIGPTGVGKTEIARRLAKLANAPFIKVEATKFTEVGYVGRDVESIIRDLVEMAVKMMRKMVIESEEIKSQVEEAIEERILEALVPVVEKRQHAKGEDVISFDSEQDQKAARETFREKLRNGDLEDSEIEIDVMQMVGVEIMAPPGMEEMTSQLQNMFQSMGNDRAKKRKVAIKDARKLLHEEEVSKLIDDDEIKLSALENVEQNGIVFIDEIDKVTRRAEMGGADVSREGVQRDLLPLVEGCAISTKYGTVKTDHILFIASGAFHLSKPSDLIPELQGRLPIRVELNALTAEDFKRILVEPDASLTEQYEAMMDTESVNLSFTEDGVARIADIAWQVNEKTENIGARRLHTVLERLLRLISFDAPDKAGESLTIDATYVDEQLESLVKDEDLSRYIL